MKKTYKIEVDCAAYATVAFMPQKMKVEFEEGADVENVMANVLKNCKKVESDCEIFLS